MVVRVVLKFVEKMIDTSEVRFCFTFGKYSTWNENRPDQLIFYGDTTSLKVIDVRKVIDTKKNLDNY